MALTGTLLADFSAFTSEAAKATAAVKGMETGADTAAAKLSKIGQGVDIKSTISDPMGTASTMATQFAESLGGVGVAAVGITASVVALGTALFELGSYSAEVIAKFDDLADKTGMSVPALSRLSNASHVIGADLGQLTDVVFKLEQRMGENSEQFQKGLTAMGLSTAELKAAGPDKYLELVTAGLKGIADPSARAAAGTEVLGKGYRDVAHALNDLEDGLQRTADIEPFTAQQAKDAEAFGFQVNALVEHFKALGIAMGAELIPVLSTFVGWLETLRSTYNSLPDAVKTVITPVNLLTAAWREGSAALEAFGIKATALPPLETLAAQTTAAHAATVKELALHVPTATEALATQKDVLKEHEAQVKKDAEALKEWQKATDAINAATTGWQATLDTLDGTVVEAIKYYLSAGVSQGDLAKAYGVTAQQVAAVKIALEDYASALNTTADLEKAELDRRKEITAITLKATNDRVLAEFQKKSAAEASEAAFLKANLADAKAQDALQLGVQATTAATVEGLKVRELAAKAAYEEIATDASVSSDKIAAAQRAWQAAHDAVTEAVKKTSTSAADTIGTAYQQHFKAAQGSFEQFQGVVMAGTAEMIAGLSSFAPDIVQLTKDMRDAQNARGQFYVDTGIQSRVTPPTRDSGGPVTAGKSYLIGGGRAPELFTPGASGFVTPNAGGGGGVVQHIYVTQPLGTPDAIARAVADAQIALMKGQGARLPYGG
jgi:hypothetical protein